ncbi:MAG: TIGR02221 family CRISPR-associated protein [Rhodocyclaceae bacterium]
MTTLISFLGKGRIDPRTGYRTARYRFEDNSVREVPFFGLALADYLKPEKIILIGTAGSMWDVFFEQQGELDEALIDAVAAERVDEELLTRHQERLTEKLDIPIRCVLIPYARDDAEQIAILKHMAGEVRERETIALDVTHGFRHLPMLALVAARYLKHVARVDIEDIYYGALEMTPPGGETPVLRLGGMLTLLDWVEALATYAKDGDYGVFTPLLDKDGMSNARQLAQAAFFERTSNPVKSREKLTTASQALGAHTSPMTELFKYELKKRIAWHRGKDRHEWELSLADAYLERRDYVRAAIFLYEAFVSRAASEQGLSQNDYDQREMAWQRAKQNTPGARKLEYLRNALTHGVKPNDKKIADLVCDETRMKEALQNFRRELFG